MAARRASSAIMRTSTSSHVRAMLSARASGIAHRGTSAMEHAVGGYAVSASVRGPVAPRVWADGAVCPSTSVIKCTVA